MIEKTARWSHGGMTVLKRRHISVIVSSMQPSRPSTQSASLLGVYSFDTLGSSEVIRALDREDVLAHHERLVCLDNLVIAVAGDVDPDAIAHGFAERLGGLDSGGFSAPAPPLEDPPREVRRAELIKDRAQAHLVIGFRGVSVADPDRFALEVISQLLAGQSGRLFLELRDKQGLAYSVTATSVEGLAPGYFAVYIATAPEKLAAARAGLLEQLRRLLDAEPSSAELEAAGRPDREVGALAGLERPDVVAPEHGRAAACAEPKRVSRSHRSRTAATSRDEQRLLHLAEEIAAFAGGAAVHAEPDTNARVQQRADGCESCAET